MEAEEFKKIIRDLENKYKSWIAEGEIPKLGRTQTPSLLRFKHYLDLLKEIERKL